MWSGWVVDHQIGIGARLDDALLSVQPEHQRWGCRGQLDPTLQRDPASDHALIHQVHAVLDAADAIGNGAEIIQPELLLFLHAERAVISGHDLQIVGAQRLPHGVLVTLSARPQWCRTHPLRTLEAGRAELIFQGEIEVLRTGFAEDVLSHVTSRS